MKSIMNRRDFLKFAGTGMATMIAPKSLSTSLAAAGARQPNLLFIYIDDMGWGDLGFMHNTFYETPNIDSLARQGVVFTSAYANAPNCAPSRACLMSGQYGPRHGVYTVGSSERGKANLRKLISIKSKVTLDPGIVTIAESLKAAGYTCGHFGKWHLGKSATTDPAAQGFDDVLVTDRADRKAKTDAHHTKQITDRAMAFMENARSKPFFCYVTHNTIHTPIVEAPKLVAKYEQKPGVKGPGKHPVVAAMVETLDKNVGRLLAKLDDLKIADNTVVFFFSDNGGVLGYSSMGPLRGCKGTLYEGGIRVPLAVRWPAAVKAGQTCDVPVMGIDFYPTMLEMASAAKPSGQILDGQSIVALLKGANKLERKAIFWHFPSYLQGNYGFPGVWRTTPAGALRSGDWKLIEYFEDGTLELYNLKDDIGERNNLAKKIPEKTAQLHRLLLQWRKHLNAPVPTKLNPKYNPTAKPNKQT